MRQILFIISVLSISIACHAQADSTAKSDSTAPEKSTLTLGVSYANNANYYGQKSQEKMAYVAVVGSYRHRSGFYLNGLAYRLLNDSNRLASAYGVGAGYAFHLSKHLSVDLGYTYTFYPKLSPFLQAANPHMANITFTHSGWLTTTISGDYAFGKTNDAFATFGLSKQVNLFSISSKDVVTLTPLIDVTGGTQRFYEYYTTEKKIRDSILSLLSPIFGNPGSGTTTTVKTNTRFDLLSYSLKLPLAYNRASYMIEASAQFSLLSNQAQSDPGKLNSFFTASFYYQF
ncbi:MAG: hypothetical protein QM731_27370 [Chitinophagaceae bacterium]